MRTLNFNNNKIAGKFIPNALYEKIMQNVGICPIPTYQQRIGLWKITHLNLTCLNRNSYKYYIYYL